MDCPHCGYDLGSGVLPARCPRCGSNLANPSDTLGADGATKRRRSVEGLTGVGHGNRSRLGRHGRHLAVAVAVIALFLVGLVVFAGQMGLVGDKVVPDVVGWRSERAQIELERAGCDVEVVEEPVGDTEAGLVTKQSLPAGIKVASGTHVTIMVAQKRTMPEVVGQSREEAEKALDELAVPVDIEEELSDKAAGTVISASLAAGRDLPKDARVRLTVAKNPQVPDVVGKPIAEAERTLSDEGFEVERKVVEKAGAKAGEVVSTSPAAGTAAPSGSKVVVEIVGEDEAALKASAEAVLQAVYGTDPAGDAVGAALRPLLAKDSPYASASDHDIWYGLVKRGGGVHAGIPSAMESLQRSIQSEELSCDVATGTVQATVSVRWAWDRLGEPYTGVVSQDVHHVTMVFDKTGGLVSFQDAQTDVPAYNRL